MEEKRKISRVSYPTRGVIVVVEIQFNYLDYEDAGIQSRNVYDVCRRFDKPVIIMEPVKGGALVNLPEEAKQVFDDLHGGSYASYAIRFATAIRVMIVEQFGFAIMPLFSKASAPFISGTTSGTFSSSLKAELLSIYTAPLLIIAGAKRLDIPFFTAPRERCLRRPCAMFRLRGIL